MKKQYFIIIYIIIILTIAYFTYFRNYSTPARLIWDERYHITSANKYLNSVFFLHNHPPLGKMFIALGEYIFQPNKDLMWHEFNYKIVKNINKALDDEKKFDFLMELVGPFFTTDELKDILKKGDFTEDEIDLVLKETNNYTPGDFYLGKSKISRLPGGYSFVGIRFFPVFFATLSSALFFLILYMISKNPHTAFLFTSLYLFENGLILHYRLALLEGSQIFFILLAILFFIYKVQEKSKIKILDYFILGILAAIPVMIKFTAFLLIVLLFLFLHKENFCRENRECGIDLEIDQKNLKLKLTAKKILGRSLCFITGFFFVFFFIFYIHFSLGKIVVNENYYGVSEKYKEIVFAKETGCLKHYPIMLKESILHMINFHSKVPGLKKNKKGEIGSYPLHWPFGYKGINYSYKDQNGIITSHFLQGNIITWYTGLISLLLSIHIVMKIFIFKKPCRNKKTFTFIIYFLILYFVYMAGSISITRVKYLYHYLIPLIICFILSYLSFNYFISEEILKKKKIIYLILILIAGVILISYLYLSPLTYCKSLSLFEYELRTWADFKFFPDTALPSK